MSFTDRTYVNRLTLTTAEEAIGIATVDIKVAARFGRMVEPLYCGHSLRQVCVPLYLSYISSLAGQSGQLCIMVRTQQWASVTSDLMRLVVNRDVFCVILAKLFGVCHTMQYCMYIACVHSSRWYVRRSVSFVVNMPRNCGKRSQNRKEKLTRLFLSCEGAGPRDYYIRGWD